MGLHELQDKIEMLHESNGERRDKRNGEEPHPISVPCAFAEPPAPSPPPSPHADFTFPAPFAPSPIWIWAAGGRQARRGREGGASRATGMNDAIISGAGSLVGGRPLHRPISRVISPARCSPAPSRGSIAVVRRGAAVGK